MSAERKNVLAVPNAALRTERDVNSAGTVLGITTTISPGCWPMQRRPLNHTECR